MTTTQQDPAALNDLLESVILKLLNLAEDEVSDVTDGKFKIGSFKGLKNMKANLAKRGVEFALKRLGAANAEQKFKLIVKLSNEHLDKFVEAIGEDVIVKRLVDIDEIVDEDAIGMLDKAGATKLADLLRKALPDSIAKAAPVAVAATAAAGATAAVVSAEAEPDNEPPAIEAEASPADDFMAAVKEKVSATPVDGETLAVLKEQLDFMTQMRDFADAAIPQLEAAISAAEDAAEAETAEEPVIVVEDDEPRVRVRRTAPAPDRGPWRS